MKVQCSVTDFHAEEGQTHCHEFEMAVEGEVTSCDWLFSSSECSVFVKPNKAGLFPTTL